MDDFWREQAEIGKIWQLVGLTTSVEREGEWFRSTLGGRSIFVQRFKDGLRGFENVCVHRGHPLRTEDKGNGPIRCGFHHWQYDQHGRALGIPKCNEMFGASPRELNARLRTLDVANCGILIFARFPNERFHEPLETYLGPGFDILRSLWSEGRSPYIWSTELKANWRLGHHISLDDYHIVAVHPSTFGKNGYLPQEVVKYYRFGRHSAYFYNADEKALQKMVEDCRNGTFQPDGYRIMQFFPNLVASVSPIGSACLAGIMQYVPVAHDRTRLFMIIQDYPRPAADQSRSRALVRRLKLPIILRSAQLMTRKIFKEDNAVCEHMQAIVHQLDRPPILGRQEERIGWFEENYADVVGDLRPSSVAAD
ncbi:aromatic ring-hydroxylating oxygenase subunit alpha [Chelatococcus reniformis]|nr:Rieske 2Fe-2S domain-containing protein [Chelatococcus reniformis]